MCRVVESRGNGYSWGCVYGCGNVVDYWNITYVSWQFSKLIFASSWGRKIVEDKGISSFRVSTIDALRFNYL